MLLNRKYRKKYQKNLPADTKLFILVMKVVAPVSLLFIFAIGADVYKLLH